MIEQTIYGATGGAVTFPTGSPVCSVGGVFFLASASDPTRSPAIGLLSHYSEQGNFNCAVAGSGFLTLKNWSNLTGTVTLTPGSNYYLSTTPGKLTLTPVQAGAIASQLLGTAVTATTLQVNVVSPTAVVANIVSDTLQMPNTPAAGMVLKSGAGGIYTPQFLGMGMGGGGWLNVKDDFGAVGDGIHDDTDALQQAFLFGLAPDWVSSTDERFRTTFMPPGAYRVTHPICVPDNHHIVGCGRGNYGTKILVDPAFDSNWNIPIAATAEYPGITRIPPAVFQNRQWAADPTGAHRWVHDMHDVNFGWTNGIVIENLIIDGTGYGGKLHGLGMDSLAENCLFKNLWVIGFTGAGLWLTGNMTAPAFENSSIWICQEGAVKVTSSPYRWSLWQGGDHALTSGVLTTGEMFFKRMSGDSNDPSYFYITQPMNVCVVGLKYEDPTGLRHVALFDVDPTIVGTGSGVMAQGGRPSFLLQGGYAITNPGPPVGSSVFRIKITGSTDYREWPKPDITLLSFFNTHRNVMVDDGAQIWAHWGDPLPDGAIIGIDSPDPLTQYNPRAFFVYSNDSNSRVGIHTHDTRVSGTTLLVPGGGHFP